MKPWNHWSKLVYFWSSHMMCFYSCLVVCILSLWICCINAVDVKAQRENYGPNYHIYHNLSRLVSDLNELQKLYSDVFRIDQSYKSREGRTQFVVIISNFSSNKIKNVSKNVKVLWAFGEHPREFFPVESLLYFLKNVTAGLDETICESKSREYSAWIVNNFDLYILPMANPDGRHIIEQNKNYCWRGTSSGVDLNRNFDWNYGGKGSSSDPTDGEYRGKYAFSEPETLIFKNLTSEISFDAFVSFHSGIRHIYIPFADSRSTSQLRYPPNKEQLLSLARKMAESCSSRQFLYGLSNQLNGYTADGTSFDYMAGVVKIPFSFAIEMWQHEHHVGRSCFDEFNPRSDQLKEELTLVHPLYVELLTYLYQWKQSKLDARNEDLWSKKILIRRKKDNSQIILESNADESKPVTVQNPEDSSSNFFMYFAVFTITIFMALLGIHHCYHLIRKKRVVSLRSLSSTFSFFKTL